MCGDYQEISLIEAMSKAFAKLLSRLQKRIYSQVIPETQCGFRSGRGTMNMILSVHQLQVKCLEHHIALYQVYVDLTKASINWDALWTNLSKVGCTSDFVRMFKQLNREMKG